MATENARVRKMLIDAGVKQLQEFGYPSCNTENIFTAPILSAFFESMLKGTKGKTASIDAEIDLLLEEIEESKEQS